MNRENEKAMFANLKTHRIKNLPSLDNEHFLVTPKNKKDALILRNAQRLSAKISDNRNKAFLRDKQYDDTWKNHQLYFQNPKYIEIENKIKELSSIDLLRNDREQYYKNEPIVEKLRNQLDDIKWELDQKEEKEKEIRKSSSISFALLHKNARKNQYDLEDLVDTKKRNELDYKLDDKFTKSKPKGFDPTQTPDYKNDMFYKLYDEEKQIEKPIEEKIKNYDELIKQLDEKHKSLHYKNVHSPEREKAFNEVQNARKEQIALMNQRGENYARFAKIQDSVHGHIPKFKR